MTKKEQEKLADLRNKFGAIYTHFQLLKEMESLKEKDPVAHECLTEPLQKIFKENEKVAIKSMDDVKKILDSFG